MGLSQATMHRLAAAGSRMLGTTLEVVTFLTKTTPTSAPVMRPGITAQLIGYSLHALVAAGGEILATDRQCRIKASDLTWAPTPYDELTRADGTRWRILSVTEGVGRPWVLLPIRQVG